MSLFFKRITISLVVLFISTYSQCMLNNIAKTHNIVHNSYKHLSLVNGAIGWETGVIRRMYDFGEIFPLYREDKRNRKFIAQYEDPEKTHQTVRLIHTLFYRVPGSIEASCFGPTTQLQDHNPLTAVQTIAKILALCESIQAEEPVFDKALNLLAAPKEMISALLNNPLLTTENNLPAWQCIIEQHKNQADELEQTATVATVTEFCKQLTSVQHHFDELLKPQARLGAEMGHVVLNSLRESDPNHIKCSYSKHMLQTVLLTFVYKKYSDDRNLILSFYNELNDNLGRRLLIPDINYNAWVKETFNPVNQKIALKKVETILRSHYIKQIGNSINQRIYPDTNIQHDLDALVYYTNQIHSFPTPIGYQKAAYEYAKYKQTPSVPDCMETAIRNFINAYAHIGVTHIHPLLENFLNTFNHVSIASSAQAHNAWLNIVSHIPYITYHRMVDETKDQSSIRTIEKGYITIPDTEQADTLCNWLKQNGYELCTPNQHGYELRPSVKNIIILLNHLLQLNLFADTNGLAQEFMRPDFVEKYFIKCCVALKAGGLLSTKNNTHKNFDVLDYTPTRLYTSFNLAEFTGMFNTTTDHGEFSLLTPTDSKKEKRTMFGDIDDFSNQPNLSLLTTNLLCKQQIQGDHLKKNPEHVYVNLFAMPLENTGFLEDIIKIFREIPTVPAIPLKTKLNIKNLLLRLVEKQPDITQRKKMYFSIIEAFLTNNDWNPEDIDISKIKPTSYKVGWEPSRENPEPILLNLFKALAAKNQGIPDAIEVAITHMHFEDHSEEAWELFELITKDDEAFAPAIYAAEEANAHNDYIDLVIAKLEIFKAFAQKGLYCTEALQVVNSFRHEVFLGRDVYIKRLILKLLTALVENDQGFSQAIEIAKEAEADYLFGEFTKPILVLFTALVKKNQGITEAKHVLHSNSFIIHHNKKIKKLAQDLVKLIIKQEKASSYSRE